ncbi:hypothetical protein SCG7109_AT_00060 [Chlamydiales bacterium SCGC AG-110-M15]|nr:hypothetical protein SCG7109_AT_00060 [Chlamydiales bacterium SCGC AG-110-M15]
MRHYLLLFLLLVSSKVLNAIPIELYGPPFAPPVKVKGLVLHQANWKIRALSYHPNGQTATALYTAANEDRIYKEIKEISFFEDGSLRSEHDLTVTDPDFIFNTPFKSHILPNGLSVVYHPNGSVAQVTSYSQGHLNGPNDSYYPNARPKSSLMYKNGKATETFQELYINGDSKTKGTYKDGHRTGEWNYFHENLIMACSETYSEGVLEGKRSTWNQSGELVRLEHFTHGLLHDELDEAAYKEFLPNGLLIESQHYFMGIPHGKHFKRSFGDRISYECNYELGKKHGQESYYFPNGQVQGRSFFVHGEPYGKHSMKFDNGNLAFVGVYNEGNASVIEYHENGKEKARYLLKGEQVHGKYEEWYPSGKLFISTHYENGQVHGPYEEWYENGTTSLVEHYRNGEKDGPTLRWAPDGKVSPKLTHSSDLKPRETPSDTLQPSPSKKLEGKIIEYDSENPDTILLELNYKDNKLHGTQVALYPSGAVKLRANFTNGVQDGGWVWLDEEGEILESSHYKNGKLEGEYLRRPKPDREIKAHYENDFLEGLYQVFAISEGKLSPIYDAQYKNNQLEGFVVEYREDRIASRIPYINGDRNGLGEFYAYNGDVYKTIEFKNDYISGLIIEYYPNGQIALQTEYKNGQKNGDEKEFFPNGNVKIVRRYLAGKKHGLSIEKTQNGTLVFEGEFKSGKRHGMFNKYNANGSPKVLQNYVDGKLHGKKRSFYPDGEVVTQYYDMGKKSDAK